MARPGFSFLVSPDSELLKQKVDQLLKQYPPSSDEWKKYIFWGDEPPDSRFWESLKQQGLFIENRAIIVYRANEWNARVWKSLDMSMACGSDAIWPFFCLECEYDNKKGFKIPAYINQSRSLEFAKKNKWYWERDALKNRNLRDYVREEAERRKLKFSNIALESFCSLIRPEAAVIANELDKLYLIYGEGEISESLEETYYDRPEANAFLCVKSLYTGNLPQVWREISRGDASSFLFFLIAILTKDLQEFWIFKSGGNPYFGYDSNLKKSLANRLEKKALTQAFVLLANIEFQVKNVKLSPEQALDKLVIELGILFSPERARQ